jgi:hypothetical protein
MVRRVIPNTSRPNLEEHVKRLILGAVAATAAASAAVLVPQAAGATGGGGSPTTEITINAKADYDTFGTQLDLGGQAKCKGTLNQGAISASVTQSPPATPYPVTLSTGDSLVVCDGQWHSFALTVIGAGFDAGPAKATVTVTPVAGSPMKTVTSWITIVNV